MDNRQIEELSELKVKVNILYADKQCSEGIYEAINKLETQMNNCLNTNQKLTEVTRRLEKENNEFLKWRERIIGIILFISILTAVISGGLQNLAMIIQ